LVAVVQAIQPTVLEPKEVTVQFLALGQLLLLPLVAVTEADKMTDQVVQVVLVVVLEQQTLVQPTEVLVQQIKVMAVATVAAAQTIQLLQQAAVVVLAE
jgi:hypothetical protein